MDIDNILTLPRWRILEIISSKPSSPLEISNALSTSVAYVSQQLKLLEAANIVKKERTGAVEKGQPRLVFSISKDILHLTILANNFSMKRLVNLDDKSKIVLRIWLIEQPALRYAIEKIYWLLEKEIENIRGIFMEESAGKKPSLIILADAGKLKANIAQLSKESDNMFQIHILKNLEQKKFSGSISMIYDPIPISTNLEKNMKGGIN
jgi:predicted transcriptional regulator